MRYLEEVEEGVEEEEEGDEEEEEVGQDDRDKVDAENHLAGSGAASPATTIASISAAVPPSPPMSSTSTAGPPGMHELQLQSRDAVVLMQPIDAAAVTAGHPSLSPTLSLSLSLSPTLFHLPCSKQQHCG